VIPRIMDKLTLDRNDPDGVKDLKVGGAFDANLVHLTGERANRQESKILKFQCMLPETVAGNLVHITASEAKYVEEEKGGRWEMKDCLPRDVAPIEGVLEVRDVGRYVLHTRAVDFDSLTRDPRWFNLASTYQIYEELQRPDSTRLAALAVLFHTRLTRPLVGMVLVFMGLSLILRDQTTNIVISAGQCIVLCGLFFATCNACRMMGDNEYLTPVMAAWLPVVLFGPLAVVQFDAIQT
jgi:lipopolysaccharide export system permease protein